MEDDKFTVEQKSCSATARAASEAFRSGNYDESSRLYFEALKEATSSFGKNSPEALGSLQDLADSYYAQAKFIESKSVYMQLVQMLRDDAKRIAALFKLAKSHEKLQEYDDAERVFNEALVLSEKTMAPGDPQVTSILEAFANLMRKARRDPRRLAELEERARASRLSEPDHSAAKTMEQVPPQEKPPGTKYVWEPKKQAELGQPNQLFSEKTSGILVAAREHPRLMKSCLCAPFAIGALVLVIQLISTIMELNTVTPVPAGGRGSAGNIYMASDTPQRITLLDHGRAQIDKGTSQNVMRYYMATVGWGEILTVFVMHKQSDSLWLTSAGADLQDESGALWLPATAKTISVVDELPALARALDTLLQQNKHYPTLFELKNPARPGKESWHPSNDPVMVEQPLTSYDMRSLEQGVEGARPFFSDLMSFKPSTAYCLHVKESDMSPGMVLLATDAHGDLIDKSICFFHGTGVVQFGQPAKQARDTTLDRHFDSIVIAASPPQFIEEAYRCFVFIASATIALGVLFWRMTHDNADMRNKKGAATRWTIWGMCVIAVLTSAAGVLLRICMR